MLNIGNGATIPNDQLRSVVVMKPQERDTSRCLKISKIDKNDHVIF